MDLGVDCVIEGSVLTRAFACATPVVASRIPGYEEVVDPEAGILVPPGDVDALADAVVGLLEDEPRRRALGEGARQIAERHYSWTTIAARLVEIYESLLEAPGERVTHAPDAALQRTPG
jgi:phosphatidylinositol alpha-mannosyltransferase